MCLTTVGDRQWQVAETMVLDVWCPKGGECIIYLLIDKSVLLNLLLLKAERIGRRGYFYPVEHRKLHLILLELADQERRNRPFIQVE